MGRRGFPTLAGMEAGSLEDDLGCKCEANDEPPGLEPTYLPIGRKLPENVNSKAFAGRKTKNHPDPLTNLGFA